MARGNENMDVFRDDADRHRFLRNVQEMVSAHGVRLYLLILMPNHAHLLVETQQYPFTYPYPMNSRLVYVNAYPQHANISAFMQGLLTGYTVYFNRRHQNTRLG